jgi:PAS domain S-box-containing protein
MDKFPTKNGRETVNASHLKYSVDLLSTIIEESPNMIFINQMGRVVYVNKKCEEIMGYSKDEFTSKDFNFMTLIAPKSRDMVKQNFNKHLKGAEVPPFEYKFVKKDGGDIDVIQTTKLIEYRGGTAILGIITDITERKKAEEELAKQTEEARFLSEMLEKSSQPFVVGGADGRILKMNQAFTNLTGYTEKELLANVTWNKTLTPPEWRDMESEIFQEVVSKGNPRRFEKEYLRKDGSRINVELLVHRKLDSNNNFENVYAFVSDITERKKVEKELRESEERFRRIFDEGPIGMILTGLDFHFLKVNPALCHMLGYTEQELTKLSFPDITHPDDVKKDIESAKKIIKGEMDVYRTQKRYIKKNKDVIWINLTASVVKNEGGKPDYFLTMVEDITESKQAELALRKHLMKYRLEEGNIYLVKEHDPSLSFEAIKDLVTVGYKGIIISRDPTMKQKAYGTGIEFIWLTEQPGESAFLHGLKGLEQKIKTLPKHSFALIERLDYLISKNGFDKTLSFIHRIRELAFLNQSIFVLSIDPATLNRKMLRQIEKECKDIERMFEKLHEDLHEILKTIYSQENVGIKLSYSGLGNLIGKSKPTVRKNIKQLIYLGYLMDEKQGKMKVIELTEKGRGLFV